MERGYNEKVIRKHILRVWEHSGNGLLVRKKQKMFERIPMSLQVQQ